MALPIEQARFIFDTIHIMRRHILDVYMRQSQRAIACLDLTLHQAHVLGVMGQRGHMTVKELAEAMQVSPPSASAVVDRLVEMGAVSREQSQVDRREVVLQLTQEGKRLTAQSEELLLESLAKLLEQMGPEYADKWCDVYKRVREVLGTHTVENETRAQA